MSMILQATNVVTLVLQGLANDHRSRAIKILDSAYQTDTVENLSSADSL